MRERDFIVVNALEYRFQSGARVAFSYPIHKPTLWNDVAIDYHAANGADENGFSLQYTVQKNVLANFLAMNKRYSSLRDAAINPRSNLFGPDSKYRGIKESFVRTLDALQAQDMAATIIPVDDDTDSAQEGDRPRVRRRTAAG